MKIIVDENIPLVNEFFDHIGKVVRLPGRGITEADVVDADALIVRSVTPVNQNLLMGARLKFVGTCTIGTDHIDQEYLEKAGINWSSAPGCNANSVVEYVYSALCQLDIQWRGAKFGIIGCGNVGGLLHRRLRAQGVECFCYDPHLTSVQNPDLTNLETVLNCDIISMHTPLVKTGPFPSYHMLGLNELRQLKKGAVLINCGRGSVVDNAALLQVLNERSDLNVVLDVWESEPNILLPLLAKVKLGTPHIAGYSYDGKLNGTEMIYKAFCRAFNLPLSTSLKSLVPPLNNTQYTLSSQSSVWANVKMLIKQAYDIGADDTRLRQLAIDASCGSVDFGQGFDELRKRYPIRREFHNYFIDVNDEKTAADWLSTLGFNCV